MNFPMTTPETALTPHVASLPHTNSTRATILLVEDDRAVRRYLEVILQRAGYTVILAADGLEAMKAALSCQFDAVITDEMMPHLSGHEFCRFLRRHPLLSRRPVLLLSGREQTTPHASEAAPDVCLVKPVRPEELTGCLARLLALAA